METLVNSTPKKGKEVKVTNSSNGVANYYGKIEEVREKSNELVISASGQKYTEKYENCQILSFVDVSNEHGDDDHSIPEEEAHLYVGAEKVGK